MIICKAIEMDLGNSYSTYNTGYDINVESISAQLDLDDNDAAPVVIIIVFFINQL